jgi:hypothetical protein
VMGCWKYLNGEPNIRSMCRSALGLFCGSALDSGQRISSKEFGFLNTIPLIAVSLSN